MSAKTLDRQGFQPKISASSKSGSMQPNGEVTLGLSLAPISHKRSKTLTVPRSRKGSKGITSDQKQRLRATAYLLAARSPQKTLSFLTLTMPSLSASEMALVNKHWANIVRTFLQWLKRRLRAFGLPGNYVSVSEIQEKRFLETGQLPLHLHIMFRGRKSQYTHWVLSPTEIRNEWLKLLSDVVGRKLESKAVENIQMVRGNAGAYIAKYMSKGSKVIQEVKKAGLEGQLPTSWLNITDPLKKHLEQSIRVLTNEEATLLFRHRFRLREVGLLAYFNDIRLPELEPGKKGLLVGMHGRLGDASWLDPAIAYASYLESITTL